MKYFCFLALVVIICASFSIDVNAAPTEKAGLRVHLTVSSLVQEAVRQLEVYWAGATPQDGDWIGIFESEPTGSIPLPPSLAVVSPGLSTDGWERTQITEQNRPNSSELLGFTRECNGYYVGYVRSEEVLASNCLRLEPTWISERPDLGSFTLVETFIPATHDAGAWGEYDPNLSISDQKVVRYSICQDEDILSQLIHGIRFQDIRAGHYPELGGSGFWLNHGAIRIHRMEDVTSQVLMFLENTPTTELVIFDVHGFTNFDTVESHNQFLAFLQQELGPYIIPNDETSGWTTTISELWLTQKKLIISYDDSNVVNSNPWLWQSVDHQWGDVRYIEDLYTYLEGVMANPPPYSRFWSAMAELTPNSQDVVTNELGGLRMMADRVNRNVTSWFQGEWGRTVNAVAVDFFRGSDIMQTALNWNDQRIAARKLLL